MLYGGLIWHGDRFLNQQFKVHLLLLVLKKNRLNIYQMGKDMEIQPFFWENVFLSTFFCWLGRYAVENEFGRKKLQGHI